MSEFDMADYANKLLHGMAFTHEVCGLCNGTGLYCWTYREQEMQERCSACNGKCSIVVERAP